MKKTPIPPAASNKKYGKHEVQCRAGKFVESSFFAIQRPSQQRGRWNGRMGRMGSSIFFGGKSEKCLEKIPGLLDFVDLDWV